MKSKICSAQWAEQSLDSTWRELIRQAWTDRNGVRSCEKIRQPAEEKLLQQTANFMAYAQKEWCATGPNGPLRIQMSEYPSSLR